MNYNPSVILYSNPIVVYGGMAIDLVYWMTTDSLEQETTYIEFLVSKDSFFVPWLVAGSVIGVAIMGKVRTGQIVDVESSAKSGDKSELLTFKMRLEKKVSP